jgi:hypothetical protein
MLLELARTAFVAELAELKRVRTRAILLSLAIVPFTLALVFGVLALFLRLLQSMEAWSAALSVAILSGVAGLVILLAARMTSRRQRIFRQTALARPISSAPVYGLQVRPLSTMTTAAALVVGILVGRTLPK